MALNDPIIPMSLRVPRALYLKFRDKSFQRQYKHNPVLVCLMELWVEGKIEVVVKKNKMTS